MPLSKNEYVNMHWATRAKYKEMIDWLICSKTLNTYYFKSYFLLRKSKITFDIYFKTNRRRDVQNYVGGGLIAWLDALVKAEIIADDSNDCIGQPIVNFYIDKANPRTEILITERK